MSRIVLLLLLSCAASGLAAQLVVDTQLVAYWRLSYDSGKKKPPGEVTQLEASGGSGSYNWAVASGTIPPGMVLNTDGTWDDIVDWDWVEDGTNQYSHTLTVEVTDTVSMNTAQAVIEFYFTEYGIAGAPCKEDEDERCSTSDGSTGLLLVVLLLVAIYAATTHRPRRGLRR